MKRFFFFLIITVSFYACKPGIPKDIIQPDKMQQVLIDIHIVDGYISTLPSADTAKKVGSAYYKGVYKKFDIDSALYNNSLDYYYKHPNLMKKMYDSISVKLAVLKEQNSFMLVDSEQITFKGIFSSDKSDTLLLDNLLNKNYNNRMLKKDVFINFGKPNTILPDPVPITQPSVAPAEEQLTPIRPIQETPTTQQ